MAWLLAKFHDSLRIQLLLGDAQADRQTGDVINLSFILKESGLKRYY
jgi:hypothetical protein